MRKFGSSYKKKMPLIEETLAVVDDNLTL